MESRNEVITTIGQYFRDKPIERAWLFGSFARGEQTVNSDIDILIEVDFSQPVGFEFVHWWLDLEKQLSRKVDLVCDGALSKYIAPIVANEKQLIYERSSAR